MALRKPQQEAPPATSAAPRPILSEDLARSHPPGLPWPAVLAIYTLTMFISASLLFLVQPMFARMVLPLLGGSPAVWNTNVVFYQVVLLAGYGYAHVMTTYLSVRRQVIVHAFLILLPLLVLPIQIPGGWSPPEADNPIPWLMALLSVAVGLPFFVVSTSSPMLQAWFARTGHRTAADPYFLYAASNVGSMLALLSYPLLIEPRLRLSEQSWVWAGGYGALVLLLIGCAAVLWRTRQPVAATAGNDSVATVSECDQQARPVSPMRRLRWVLLALAPSSLMMSVTTYLTTNVAPIPLLWIIPLTLYLLTFILVFSRRQLIPLIVMQRAMPIVLLPLLILIVVGAAQPIELLLPLHLLLYFIAAMVCHGSLAADRPGARHLTEFYLLMSIGGAVGGMLTALVAPLLFTSVVEYPIALALLALLGVAPDRTAGGRLSGWRFDLILPGALAAVIVALLIGAPAVGAPISVLHQAVIFAVALLCCFAFSRRPVRFSLGIIVVVVAGSIVGPGGDAMLLQERNFFGIKRVMIDRENGYHLLSHGDVLHGSQSLDPERRREPLTYYTRSGPLGHIVSAVRTGGGPRRVAAVGLGTGTVACYAEPGDSWTYYEIDPAVVRIAQNPAYFTFLRDCSPDGHIQLGDARQKLNDAPAAAYDLIILDAYSGDAVPVHLLTREAIDLYLAKLAPGGMLAFHVSNRFFDLRPALGVLAEDAGLVAYKWDDVAVSQQELDAGKRPSQWAVLAPTAADLAELVADQRWQVLPANPALAVWTDDYSSILSALRLRYEPARAADDR